MSRIIYTTLFPAPLARVWPLFSDPARWTLWNKEWAAIRDVRGPFDHPGAGYTQVLRVCGRELLGRWEVTACQPGAWRRVEGRLPFGLPFRGQDCFRETRGGTRFTVEIEWDMPWGWLGRVVEVLTLPLFRQLLAANARRAARLLREERG